MKQLNLFDIYFEDEKKKDEIKRNSRVVGQLKSPYYDDKGNVHYHYITKLKAKERKVVKGKV